MVPSDVAHAELQHAAGLSVAARVGQAARYRLQRHVARLQQRLAAVRTLAAGELEAGPAAGADIVSGLAHRDWWQHVLSAERTGQYVEHVLTWRWLFAGTGGLRRGLGCHGHCTANGKVC